MTNQFKAAMRSGMGCVRINNEDAYYFNGRFSTLSNMNQETALQGEYPLLGSLFAVADGIGGASSGEVASSTAVARLDDLKERLKTQRFTEIIGLWVRETNGHVLKAAPGGGCTLALLFATGQAIFITHIGDSRVYRLHEGQLHCMTKDHSKVQMLMDAGIITPEQAAVSPQRHMVVRFLGMDEEENGICTATISRPMPLIHGDRYLICTDGVSDMLDSHSLEDIMKGEAQTDACAEALYRGALAAGGTDNITLIVLDVVAPDVRTAPLNTREEYEEDVFENTLGRTSSPSISPKKEDDNKVCVTHTCQLPQVSGERIIVRSEISFHP